MDKLVLQASPRTVVGKKVRALRQAGKLPAVLYGHDLKPQSLELDAHDFGKIFADSGQNTILDLKIAGLGNDYNVLVHEVDRDPVHDVILHVDLYRVKMDEEIRTHIPLHFTGESTAVFQDGGSLLTNLEELEIETLPAHLPANIEVDISVLDDFEKTITVADVTVPDQVKILNDPEELIAKVEPPRSDEELAELDSEIIEELPEGAIEGDEAEAAEGEEGNDSGDEGDKSDKATDETKE